jgi:hypothetical protein
LKVRTDISNLISGYESLKTYQKKYEDTLGKLRKISISSNSKYSVLLAVKENKIQTTPEDKAYPFEVDAFHLRRIIEISIHVLEKQIQNFKKSFYPRYAIEITKLRKNIIAKNLKSNKIWKQFQNLIQI